MHELSGEEAKSGCEDEAEQKAEAAYPGKHHEDVVDNALLDENFVAKRDHHFEVEVISLVQLLNVIFKVQVPDLLWNGKSE